MILPLGIVSLSLKVETHKSYKPLKGKRIYENTLDFSSVFYEGEI